MRKVDKITKTNSYTLGSYNQDLMQRNFQEIMDKVDAKNVGRFYYQSSNGDWTSG